MTRISAAHRDALYELLIDRLSGIGDVWMVICAGDWETASRLAWEFSDALRLIVEDLGWGDGPGRSIELSAPPELLRRVFSRLLATAAAQRTAEEPGWAEVREREERNRLVGEACEAVLADLDSQPSPPC